MRRDQPKLRKQFKELNEVIDLLKRKIDHRENIVEYLVEQRTELLQELMIARIEYDRLLMGEPALTTSYAWYLNAAVSISEM